MIKTYHVFLTSNAEEAKAIADPKYSPRAYLAGIVDAKNWKSANTMAYELFGPNAVVLPEQQGSFRLLRAAAFLPWLIKEWSVAKPRIYPRLKFRTGYFGK